MKEMKMNLLIKADEKKPESVMEPTFAEFKMAMIAARIQMLAPNSANGLTNYVAKLYKIMGVPIQFVTQEQTNAILDATLGIFAYTKALLVKNTKEKESK